MKLFLLFCLFWFFSLKLLSILRILLKQSNMFKFQFFVQFLSSHNAKKKRSEQSVLVAKKTAILVDVYLAGENFVMLYSWRYFRRTSVRSQGAVEGGCGVVQ